MRPLLTKIITLIPAGGAALMARGLGAGLRILVLTEGAARQWVANQSHLMSAQNVLRTSDNKPQPKSHTTKRSPL